MAIGERIHFFRLKRGMTQKYLGQTVGFPERSADVRLAQYETGTRTPKADLTTTLAAALDVSPQALAVPDIDSYIGLMHTLFCLEDRYGLTVDKRDGEVVLRVDVFKGREATELHEMLSAWAEQVKKLKTEEISQEQYDSWRYYYPKYDTTGHWHKITPSQGLSDLLVDELKNSD
jgi:transcriptional regulator with XRE-family HTH domain